MPAIPCFSSAEKLGVIFENGALITFIKPGDYSPNTCTISLSGPVPKSRIRIATMIDEMRHADGSIGTNLLEEQKVTLIHEFVHIFIAFRLQKDRVGGQYLNFNMKIEDFELAIDSHAYRIVRDQSNLLEDIVCQLILAPNCNIKYEVAQTPFRHFHQSILRDKILPKIAGVLKFGDPKQIEILNLVKS